jgi:hypothetical protein
VAGVGVGVQAETSTTTAPSSWDGVAGIVPRIPGIGHGQFNMRAGRATAATGAIARATTIRRDPITCRPTIAQERGREDIARLLPSHTRGPGHRAMDVQEGGRHPVMDVQEGGRHPVMDGQAVAHQAVAIIGPEAEVAHQELLEMDGQAVAHRVVAIIGPEVEVAHPRVTTVRQHSPHDLRVLRDRHSLRYNLPGLHSLRPGQHQPSLSDRHLPSLSDRDQASLSDQHHKADRHRKAASSLANTQQRTIAVSRRLGTARPV